MAGGGEVVIVEASADSTTSLDRARGFRDAAARHPDIRIAGGCHGAYQFDAAHVAMARLLAGTRRVDAVLAANDVMALGAIAALQAAGRSALVVGVNAIPDAIAAIKAGTLLATADFNAMNLGVLAAECAVRRLRGEAVPREIMLPTEIVDRSNVGAWDLPYEQRACIEWAAAIRANR
jgi:ribose transport system substrate-binding protein